MPQITNVLENESGIQYDRPNDKTGSTGIAPINNVIVGKFKRGRTDQLLNITKQNIRAVLGFDPTNLSYVAVQDALDTNIPSVKVLRVVDTINVDTTETQNKVMFEMYCSWNGIDSTGMPKYFRLYNDQTNQLLIEVDLGTNIDQTIADLSVIPNIINSANLGLMSQFGDAGQNVLEIMYSYQNPSSIRKFRLELNIGNEGLLRKVAPTIAELISSSAIGDHYLMVAKFQMKPINIGPIPVP
nr:hypothetical protein [uncultured Acinetobacter sp.]